MISYRESLNTGLRDLLRENEKVILLGEDIRDPYGGAFKVTKGLTGAFSDRIINTPVSEAAIVGAAGGLAAGGFYPIVEIMFGDFITLCVDQIVNHLTKFRWVYDDKLDYSVMVRTPMGGRRGYGPTHSQSLEKLFFGIPNITIVAPSLVNAPGTLLKKFISNNGLTVFIEDKLSYGRKIVDDKDLTEKGFNINRSKDVYETVTLGMEKEEPDLTIAAYGGMVPLVLEAVKELFYKYEVLAELVIPSLIIPLNTAEVVNSLRKTGKLMVIEEGTLTHGWGSELSAFISQFHFDLLKAPVKRMASRNMVIGSSKAWEDYALVQKEDIVREVLS